MVGLLSQSALKNIKNMNGSDNSFYLMKDQLSGDGRDMHDQYFVPVDASHVTNSPYPFKDILYECVNTINVIIKLKQQVR